MKTICIIAYQRTGSSWLSNSFAGPNSYSAYELVSNDPLLFFYRLVFLLKNIYKIDDPIVETFEKIYHPDNFFVDVQSNFSIKSNILSKKPYSKNLLKTFQKILYHNNLNFIFKLFPENIIYNDIEISEIEDISDYIIMLYRNDIISSFISESKALLSGKWSILETQKKYQEKINWNIDSYNNYLNNILQKISVLEDCYSKIQKPKISISYESIHDNANEIDKINYLYKCLLSIDKNFKWDFNNDNFYKKENTSLKIEDNFYNPVAFKDDLHKIRRYIYE